MKTKILQKTLLILIPGFAALLVATTANAQNLVALQGNLHQTTLVSQTCNGGVCNSVFQGSGTVNIMGPMTWTNHVTQDFNPYPCNPALSDITMVGATGSITISDSSVVCPSATGHNSPYTIQGVWNVTGGSGQFSGIAGSGATQGTIGGQGPNVGLSGIVVY
jgi:hypothetical protein